MRPNKIHLLSGIGVALVIGVAAVSSGGDPAAADGVVVAASVDEPVIMPLVSEPEPATIADLLEQAETTTTTAAPTTTTTAPPPPPPTTAPPAPTTTAPPPPPAPSYAPGTVEEIISRYFGASSQKAIAVARCESSLNPNAVSPGGGNHGLFQINNVHSGTWPSVTGAPWSARYDAELNTKFAHWLWSQQGWGPWACA